MMLLLGRLQKEKRMFIIILIYWLANPSIIFLKSNIFTYKNIFAANAKKGLIFLCITLKEISIGGKNWTLHGNLDDYLNLK